MDIKQELWALLLYLGGIIEKDEYLKYLKMVRRPTQKLAGKKKQWKSEKS
jgi:hypothetical protein